MSRTRPLTEAEKAAMGDAAELIRTHLWRGKQPPPPPHPKDKPWTMGRCLSIYKRLIFCGYDPADLNAAIPRVRDYIKQDVPLRMTVFYNGKGYATPLLEQCIGAHHKARPEESFGPHAKHKLPPRIRDVLRGMVE